MIPDEAVEAALAEWPRWPRPVEEVRRMLSAAAPHLMAAAWEVGRKDGRMEAHSGYESAMNPYEPDPGP